MRNFLSRFFSPRYATALAALALALSIGTAFLASPPAESYPYNTPTYTPTQANASKTLTAAGYYVFNTQNIGNLVFDIAGTNTGLSGLFRCSAEVAGTPVWKNMTGYQVGGPPVSTVTADGVYIVRSAGFLQCEFDLTAISTGSAIINASGTPAGSVSVALPLKRGTYGVTTTAITIASSATDIVTITGAANVVVRVHRVECWATSTAVGEYKLLGIKRSTANATGTHTAPTIGAFDSASPATALATVLQYSANPGTLGTAVATLRESILDTNVAATQTYPTQSMVWDFGKDQDEDVTLRAATDVFAINGNAASAPSGTSMICSLEWSEE